VGLVSLTIQLGFAGQGIQVKSLLKSQAQTLADEFIAQAEKLGPPLRVMAAIFYFMPFVITVLVVVGVPLISIINYVRLNLLTDKHRCIKMALQFPL
jgi:hypothetical protein